MADLNQDWDDLGRNIQDIVDRAINARDYQKLEQTIRQTVSRAVDLGSEAVRRAVDGTSRPVSSSRHQEAKHVEVIGKKELPVLYGNTSGRTVKGILKLVGGGLISVVGFTLSVAGLVLLLAEAILTPLVLSLGGLAGGVLLLGSGVRTLNRVSRFKTYRKTLGQKTYCTLEKLARSVGRNVKYVRKELRQMISEGLFLEGHLDKEETHLITSNETYRHYEQSRLQLEERQRLEAAAKAQKASVTLDPQVQEVLERGDAFIAQIRKCNDDIPGQEISEKISRIELIVQRIFDRAEAHPEIVPDLKKMMDYYLPMTVKLLNAYADMDAQPVQGETIVSSKREIEATLDTLNLAFEKLLDSVFADTAMDVSSDISVLNTMLAQEGLTEDELSKMKKQQSLQ